MTKGEVTFRSNRMTCNYFEITFITNSCVLYKLFSFFLAKAPYCPAIIIETERGFICWVIDQVQLLESVHFREIHP